MKTRWPAPLFLLLLLLVGAGQVAGQQTGSVDGSVVDANGSPLPGTSVEVRSPSLQGTRTTVSDAAGRFRFPALPPGTYTVTAALAGFTKAERTNIRVGLGATASVPISLSVSVKEEVVVTGEAPVVNLTQTTVGQNTTFDSLQKLPLARNFAAVAQRAAGAGTDNAGGVTVYGATSLENQYVIDGVNTSAVKGYALDRGSGNAGKSLNAEFIQEVEVKTGGYEAEYGRALGGVINVITKSGGNEFHGDLFGYYDSESLTSNDKRADDRSAIGSAKRSLPDRLDVGAGVGGFFLKDRIWFYGAFDHVRRDEDWTRRTTARNPDGTSCVPNCPTSTGTRKDRTNLFSGKLTFRLGDANTIAVTAFGDPGEYENRPITTTPGPDSAVLARSDFGGTDFSAKYDGIFGSQFLAQLQYGRHQETNDYGSVTGANDITTHIRSQTGFVTEYFADSGFALLPLNEDYKRDAIRLTGSAFFGAHEVKLGGDYEIIKSEFEQRYSGPAPFGARITERFTATGGRRTTQHRYYGTVPLGSSCLRKTDGTTPAAGEIVPIGQCVGWRPGNDFSEPDTRNFALFLQDTWKILPNLTVNAGVRYETQKLKDASGRTAVDIKDEWSPRLGLVYDPLNNGRSKVFASYGRFYTTIPQDIQTRSLGREATVIVTNDTASNVLDPINTSGVPFAQTGDFPNPAGLKGMYQDEIIGGVQYEFLKGWSVGVKGIYKALGRVVEDRCDILYNRDVQGFLLDSTDPYIRNYQPTCALINVDEGGTLGTIKDPGDPKCYPDGAVDEDTFEYVKSSPCEGTRATRYYRGIEVDVTHQFSNQFFLQASYVYSQLNGNYSGNLSQTREAGQFDPNINADFDYPGLVTNSNGLLRNDRPHQFKLTGFYSFPFGLSVGMNFTYASGRPINLIGCPEDYVACASGYSVEGYIVPKGTYGRMPAVYEADLHLEYSLRLGPVSVTPVVDVFNLLNRQGKTSQDDVYNNQGDAALNAPCTDPASGQTGYFASCAPNANYTKAIAWQDARSVRLGARISF